MLLLSAAEVRAALDPDALVDALAAGYAQLSAGAVDAPARTAVTGAGATVLLMGAHRRGGELVTAKLVSLREGEGSDIPTHHAVIVAFDAVSGVPRAVLDGEVITAARTAATSRLAVRLLSAPDASVLAVLGAGVQARAHLEALLREREWADVRVAARRPQRAAALAEAVGGRAVASVANAVAGAHVVCAATSAAEPVVAAVASGALVTSVGFGGDEVDRKLVAGACVVVESRAAALAPPPTGARELAGVTAVTELGELVAPRHDPGRVTLFKSVGVALADDVATSLVLAAAEAGGLGTRVAL